MRSDPGCERICTRAVSFPTGAPRCQPLSPQNEHRFSSASSTMLSKRGSCCDDAAVSCPRPTYAQTDVEFLFVQRLEELYVQQRVHTADHTYGSSESTLKTGCKRRWPRREGTPTSPRSAAYLGHVADVGVVHDLQLPVRAEAAEQEISSRTPQPRQYLGISNSQSAATSLNDTRLGSPPISRRGTGASYAAPTSSSVALPASYLHLAGTRF